MPCVAEVSDVRIVAFFLLLLLRRRAIVDKVLL